MNEVTKPGYKKTKFGWIPEEWKILRLSEVIELESGQHLSPNEYNGEKAGIPYFTGPTDFCNDKKGVNKWTSQGKKVSEKEDILITVKGSGAGTLYISKLEKVAIGRQLMAIKPTKIAQGYVYNFLIKRQRQLELLASGNMIPGLSRKDILNFRIPLPPLPEQKKIAEILSTWDEAIETLERLITKKEELKKGLMQQLLISQKANNCKEIELGEIGDFFKGKGISKSEVRNEGIPAVRYGELYTNHHIIIKRFSSFINESSAELSRKIQTGDILFAGSGETVKEIGKCAVFTDEFHAYAGGDIVIFRTKKANPTYLSYYLNSSEGVRQMSKLGQGHSVVHIYAKNLKQIKVLLPNMTQQEKVIQIFYTLEKEIEAFASQKSMFEVQKKGLMQQLLTGKTRVSHE